MSISEAKACISHVLLHTLREKEEKGDAKSKPMPKMREKEQSQKEFL